MAAAVVLGRAPSLLGQRRPASLSPRTHNSPSQASRRALWAGLPLSAGRRGPGEALGGAAGRQAGDSRRQVAAGGGGWAPPPPLLGGRPLALSLSPRGCRSVLRLRGRAQGGGLRGGRGGGLTARATSTRSWVGRRPARVRRGRGGRARRPAPASSHAPLSLSVPCEPRFALQCLLGALEWVVAERRRSMRGAAERRRDGGHQVALQRGARLATPFAGLPGLQHAPQAVRLWVGALRGWAECCRHAAGLRPLAGGSAAVSDTGGRGPPAFRR